MSTLFQDLGSATFGVLYAPTITDAMVVSITDDNGELAEDLVATDWNPATNYAIGDEVSRATTHRVYSRLVAGTTATEPENDPTNWHDMRPTNRWAAFDLYGSTQLIGEGELTITLKPTGFVTGVWLGGLLADEATVEVRSGTAGGPVVYPERSVYLAGLGRYDWQTFFLAPQAQMTSAYWGDIPIGADPVVIIKLHQLGGSPRVGTIQVGQFIGVGFTQYNADFGRVRYSTQNYRADGTIDFTRRPSGGDVNLTALLSPEQAITLDGLLEKFDARPALWIGSTENTHAPLTKFGVIEGRVKYPYYGICEFSGNITGLI